MSKDVKINDDGTTEKTAGEVDTVEGKGATENRGRLAIQWQLGEAKYALDEGIDYQGILSEKNPDTDLLISEIRNAVQEDPAVTEVNDVTLDLNRDTRKATITVTATVDEGEEIQIKTGLEV